MHLAPEVQAAAVRLFDGQSRGTGVASLGPPRLPCAGELSAVVEALARAIEAAVTAGRWDVVARLARELEARRLEAATNGVWLDRARGR